MTQPTFRTDEAFVGEAPGPHENPPAVSSVKRLALAAMAKHCENCNAPGARQQPCRTSYADPKENVSPWLCAKCAEDYHDYWDSLWADYYSGSGVVYVTPEQLKAQRLKAAQR